MTRLDGVEVPGAHDAEVRAWTVVRAAHRAREPVPAPRRGRLAAVAVTVVLAVAALATVSPPGRAVIDRVREAVGIETAMPALFSLPTGGSLLVSSDRGVWVVRPDGSRRLLGPYREASWSPFGRFVVAARANELAALEPDGTVRWSLARPGVRSPRWTGPRRDTRIAYVDRTGLRVVAGDGTGDRLVVPRAPGPVAWRPGAAFVVAVVTRTGVSVLDATSGATLWRAPRPGGPVTRLEWSDDGRRLLVLTAHRLRVYRAPGTIVAQEDPSDGWPDVAATFRPGSHELAVARVHGSRSTAYLLGGRTLFDGTGVLRSLTWSPDGTRLLVAWPTADQWVFVSARGRRRIDAVANVSAQFRSRGFPRVEGWCCVE